MVTALKENRRPKLAVFPTFFFGGKPDIGKVRFVELFPLVTCFLQGNYIRRWAFPTFAAFSLWTQKLNQQPRQ